MFVYCHSDGYLEYNGKVLFDNYDTSEKVESLIALGDISFLEKTPESTRDYNSWRGEEINIQSTSTRDKVRQQEYAYIFSVEEERWYAKGHGFDWMLLEGALNLQL